ncbi:hypothetical protein AMPH_11679 [Acinetobacter baumannii]|nr:hypothetical protein AMPH_11679 [Acinetobacter baumannii]
MLVGPISPHGETTITSSPSEGGSQVESFPERALKKRISGVTISSRSTVTRGIGLDGFMVLIVPKRIRFSRRRLMSAFMPTLCVRVFLFSAIGACENGFHKLSYLILMCLMNDDSTRLISLSVNPNNSRFG